MTRTNGVKFERNVLLAICCCILVLGVVDCLSTRYVIDSGIGYEANVALELLVDYDLFFVFKIVMTAFVLLGIYFVSSCRASLMAASYVSIWVFYLVVCINNISVALFDLDLRLSLGDLLIIGLSLFALCFLIQKNRGVAMNIHRH